MTGVLHNLLVCTISGSIMFGLGSLLNLKFKSSSMSRWYYAIMIMSLVMFLAPLQLVWRIPKLISISLPTEATIISGCEGIAADGAAGAAHHIPVIGIIFGVWLSGAVILGIRSIVLYIKAAGTIKRISSRCTNDLAVRACEKLRRQLKIHRRVRVAVSGSVSSPLLFGILRPVIIIPDNDFDDDRLKMIFAHELTHLKHLDLHIKLLGILVGCVHWFNPVVYLLRRTIDTVCEWCCDESVLKLLKLEDNKDYGRLIISVIEGGQKGVAAYSTSMASTKSHMKRRLLKIAGFREVTKTLKAAGILLAAAMSVCSMTAFGFTQAASVMPEEIASVFAEPEAVSREFSASARTKQSSAPNQEGQAYAPSATATAEPENTGYTDGFENNFISDLPESTESTEPAEPTEPEESKTEPTAHNQVFDNADNSGNSGNSDSAENSGNSDNSNSSENTTYYEAPNTEAEGEYNEPQKSIVTNAPAELYAQGSEPEPEAENNDVGLIQVPGKSVYVFDAAYDGADSVTTPILEVVKSTSLSIIPTRVLSAIQIYRCNADGSGAECIYDRTKNVPSSLNLTVNAGEYYYITITGEETNAQKGTLIIQ